MQVVNLERVELCGTKFVQSERILIEALAYRLTGVSQKSTTKSRMRSGRTLWAALGWHFYCVIAFLCRSTTRQRLWSCINTKQVAAKLYRKVQHALTYKDKIMRLKQLSFCLLLVCCTLNAPSYAAECNSIQLPIGGNEIKQLKGDFEFLEGPTWSSYTNNFYFSEMHFAKSVNGVPPSNIYQLTLPGTIELFVKNSGTNGLISTEKSLLLASHQPQEVARFDLTNKARTSVATNVNGKHFNSPNDLVLHSSGKLFFSDPDWQLGDRDSETGITGVYFVDKAGKVTVIDRTLKRPNGVALSKDESRLYVGDFENKVTAYLLSPEGTPTGEKFVFAKIVSPDGMAVDCADNLYVTSHSEGSIHIFSPDGSRREVVNVGPNTTNLAFGGKDLRTILITTADGLFYVKGNITGMPER